MIYISVLRDILDLIEITLSDILGSIVDFFQELSKILQRGWY
jgi:hypothetical protein